MAKKAPFFSHDMNARHDPKMSAMRGVYGSQGYGWFWMLIEMMAESDGYQLDCKSKYTFNAYGMQLQCNSEEMQKFITDCIVEFELFESDSMYFWSNSLRNRMQYRDLVSEKRTEAANKRWEKRQEDANASKINANAMQNDANKTKQNKTLKDTVDSNECDDAFERWYSIYPKQGSVKKKAFESWKSLWKDKKIDIEKLMNGTNSYIAYQNHNQYKTCGAQVFLNQQRWEDNWSIQETQQKVVQFQQVRNVPKEYVPTPEDIQRMERMRMAHDV